MNIKELAIKYDAAKVKIAEINTDLSIAKADKDEAEEALLSAMVEEGIPNIRIDGIGLLSMKTENYMSVTKANEYDFIEYLKATGNGGLLKETLDSKTQKVFLQGHIEELKKKFTDEKGLDEIEARDAALEFLKTKGVSYFSDKSISQTGKGK